MVNCEKCKHYDYQFIWDDDCEEEVPVHYCNAGNNGLLDITDYVVDRLRKSGTENTVCPFYEEYKFQEYKEEDTECDKCDKLEECKDQGIVVNCTTVQDMRQHYIIGRCDCLKKMGC